MIQRNAVAESQGLLAVHRIGVSAGDVDGVPDFIDPAHILQERDLLVGNSIVIRRAQFRARGETREGAEGNQMCRGVLKHMGGPDKRSRLFHCHVLAVDEVRPDVADLLFALQIILRHVLHRDHGVFKVLYLSAV